MASNDSQSRDSKTLITLEVLKQSKVESGCPTAHKYSKSINSLEIHFTSVKISGFYG